MEIPQQQMVLAMAVTSICLSLIERTRQLKHHSSEYTETMILLLRAADLAQAQIQATHQSLVAMAQSAPTEVAQTHSLRILGLTQQAHSMVSQLNLDRKTLALGPRSAPQIPPEQIALRVGRALDTWETEIIGATNTLSGMLSSAP